MGAPWPRLVLSAARNRELRGAHESSVSAGRRIRARDVGAFVQAEGGRPEWGSTVANAMGTFVLGVLGVLSLVSASLPWGRVRRLSTRVRTRRSSP